MAGPSLSVVLHCAQTAHRAVATAAGVYLTSRNWTRCAIFFVPQ
jgi:hypothetical protein